MDLTTVIGLVICWFLVIAAMIQGGEPMAFVDFPSVLITVGGTIGAVVVSNPPERLKSAGKILKIAFQSKAPDLVALVQTMVSFAEKARREGLLALEADAAELDNVFLKKAIQLVVDGTDPELVKAILDTEIGILEDRHASNKLLLDGGAELAPAFGMLGTLIGLIAMLGNLHPVGVVLAALFFSAISVGSQTMSRMTGVPSYISEVIQGLALVVMLVALLLTEYRVRRRRAAGTEAGRG